jgi:hypothetical protein
MASTTTTSHGIENQQQVISAPSASQQHKSRLLQALEISPYELAILEKHLLSHGWIPETTSEEAIDEAVLKFCESFHQPNHSKFPYKVWRLNTLFEAYVEDDEAHRVGGFIDNVRDDFVCVLKRETAKYDAVRTIIADIAIREERKRGDGDQASQALQAFQRR